MSHVPGFEVFAINGGRFRMDGGCMFGVIPKLLWDRKTPADENNRIRMQSTCVVVKTDTQTVLMDTGYGAKHGERFQKNHVLSQPMSLLQELEAIDVHPEQVDIVILSHLHFDHAGGCTYRTDDGNLRPQFPNARHLIHQFEWEDAMSDRQDLVGAYFSDDLLPLDKAGLVDLVEDGHEVLPGITLQHTGGHTRGHQIAHIQTADQHYAFLSDFCPTAAHLPPYWTLSYDTDYLHLRRTKPIVLSELVDNNAIAIFGHDPIHTAARIARDERQGFVVSEVVDVAGR